MWTRQEVSQNLSFIKSFAPRVLTYFEDHFNLTYPMEKLDLVFLPARQYLAVSQPGIVIMHQ